MGGGRIDSTVGSHLVLRQAMLECLCCKDIGVSALVHVPEREG